MAPPEHEDAGNPFQSLLGDLMNMLGSTAPDQWAMTRSFALNVATGGVAEPNVIETTGMPVSPDGRRLTCVPVGRGDWTARALESWRPILTAMAAPNPTPTAAPPTEQAQAQDRFDEDPTRGLAGLIGQWATAIGPMFFGLQVGSVVGHLAQRTLGQLSLIHISEPT